MESMDAMQQRAAASLASLAAREFGECEGVETASQGKKGVGHEVAKRAGPPISACFRLSQRRSVSTLSPGPSILDVLGTPACSRHGCWAD